VDVLVEGKECRPRLRENGLGCRVEMVEVEACLERVLVVLVGRVEVELEVEAALRRTGGSSGGGIRVRAGVDLELESNVQRKGVWLVESFEERTNKTK
jgi:hypothetical protein